MRYDEDGFKGCFWILHCETWYKRMSSLQFEKGPIDEIDARILKRLAEDARISHAELARQVGLSAPSVSERVKRLEDVGVIEGYGARINPQKLGRPLAAWLRIRPVPGQLRQVCEILEGLQAIVECDRVTGEDCFLAKAQVASVVELERLIDKVMPYAMTNTSIIQSSPVGRRLPPIAVAMPFRRGRARSAQADRIG